MSPHETLVAETREWLARAQADLAACVVPISAGLAAEAWHQVLLKKTHDLDELKQSSLPLAIGAPMPPIAAPSTAEGGLQSVAVRYHNCNSI